MNKVILLFGVLLFASCTKNGKLIVNEHVNLIITPDLSNRIEDLYSKPVSDVTLINGIYNNYHPAIYNIKNRKVGQKDEIRLLFTNPAIISNFSINLNNISYF